MVKISEQIKQRLQKFTQQLERGTPIKATRVTRINTPDGPMHIHKKVTLRPTK